MASVDIIIVNWNAGAQLKVGLQSVLSTNCGDHQILRVVVVDNASSDRSMNDLKDIDLPLHVIHNDENVGFGAACNQGATHSQADFLLLLNPDARLSDNALEQPMTFLDTHEEIGVVGVQLLNDSGKIARSCARFMRPQHIGNIILGLNTIAPALFKTYHMWDWDHTGSRYVDHVMGSFYLIRRQLFESLGGFDNRFCMYLEDLDLSLRVHQSGWQIYYLAEANAYHRGGGTSEQVRAYRLSYLLHSRIQYSFKHFGLVSAGLITLATLVVEPVTRLIRAIFVRRSLAEAGQTLKGYVLLLQQLIHTIADDK